MINAETGISMVEELGLEPGSVEALREELYAYTLTLKSFWQDHPEVEDTEEEREIIKQAIEHVKKACSLLYD